MLDTKCCSFLVSSISSLFLLAKSLKVLAQKIGHDNGRCVYMTCASSSTKTILRYDRGHCDLFTLDKGHYNAILNQGLGHRNSSAPSLGFGFR